MNLQPKSPAQPLCQLKSSASCLESLLLKTFQQQDISGLQLLCTDSSTLCRKETEKSHSVLGDVRRNLSEGLEKSIISSLLKKKKKYPKPLLVSSLPSVFT